MQPKEPSSIYRGIRGTVVARWTAGQHVERSILRHEQYSYQNSSYSLKLSPAKYSLKSAESWPKTPIISFHLMMAQFT